MAREKFQTLTEQMFYVLLCFRQDCCGTDVMEKTRVITDNRVKIGPGTLYNLIDQFLQEDIIQETKIEGRKKSYILAPKGQDILDNECNRLQKLINDYKSQI